MREMKNMTALSITRSRAYLAPSLPRLALLSGFVVLLALAFAAMSPAYAMTLDEAKAQGVVGEMSTGYVGYPSAPSAAVKQLGDGVNLGRKAQYSQIAASQGTSLSVVEQLAGSKLIGQAPAGQYVNDGSGWRRK